MPPINEKINAPDGPADGPTAPEAKRRKRRRSTIGTKPRMSQSFNNALEGIIYTLKTERNIRVHFLVGVLVIAGAVLLFIGVRLARTPETDVKVVVLRSSGT